MMRTLKLAIIATLTSLVSFAQTNTTLTIDKAKQSAQSITLPDDNDLVKNFIEDLIKKSGGKAKRSNGFIHSRNVESPELDGTKKAEVYFDIVRAKNSGKEISIVNLVVKDDNEKFASDTLNNELFKSAGNWLNSFQMKLEVYKRDQEIIALTKELKDVNGKLSALRKNVRNDKDDNIAAIKENEKKLDDISERLEALRKN